MVLTWAGRTPAPEQVGASRGGLPAESLGWRGKGLEDLGWRGRPLGVSQHRGVCRQAGPWEPSSCVLNVLCIVTESWLCTACCGYKIEFFTLNRRRP